MTWNLACPDWEARLKSGGSLVPRLPLNEDEAARAVRVFNRLRLADVPGTPYMAEAAGEWFRDIVRALFGSVDPITRNRLIRELFVLVSKKNNKTTGGALLMLTAQLLNKRPNAEFFFVAPVHDTAEVAFSATAGAIALDQVLSKKFHVREHLKKIVHLETGSELSVLTFDPTVLTGQKVSGGVLIDELHVVAKANKASSAIRQLRGGMVPFPESFMAFITTQSEEAPSGVFRAELMKARAIRDGTRTGSMLPVLYEFPQAMQATAVWRNPDNWWMVNPNHGRSISIERLEELFDSAQATGEEELRSWASQHLNVEIGLALHSDRWAGADFWEEQARPAFTLDELLARCEVVDVGIDGGGLDDLLGLAVVGREAKTREWMAWTHAWAHPSVLERRKSESQRFLDFAADGDLTLVHEIGEDVEEIAGLVAHVHASGKLDRIGLDPAGIGAILDALVAAKIPMQGTGHDGKPFERVVGISQGWKMTGAIKTTERKLAEGVLIHGGQKMMNWVVGNAKVEPKGNAVVITKQAAGTAKIDPLMALFNAMSLLSMNPASPTKAYQLLFV
jgi:phage terminase large subunit-like protein